MRALSVIILLILVISFGCEKSDDIIEPVPFVVVGSVFDSVSSDPLEGVLVLKLLRVGPDSSDVQYEQQAVTAQNGSYDAILGVSLVESRWMFQKDGYEDAEFMLPSDASQTGEYGFELNVFLVPTPLGESVTSSP